MSDEVPIQNAHLPRLTELSATAGCAAKIGQADLRRVLAHLPLGDDPRLVVGHATREREEERQTETETARQVGCVGPPSESRVAEAAYRLPARGRGLGASCGFYLQSSFSA